MVNKGRPTPERTERAARELSSPDTLLPGEAISVSSGRLDDATHWAAVYEELFAFKQNLLATLVVQRQRVEPDGQREVENDEVVLTREADRLARRLEYWRAEVQKRSGDSD